VECRGSALGGMVGLVRASAVLGGMECAAVRQTGEGGALGMREVAAAGLSMHGAGWRGVG
jgi:hypothetical protein